MNFIASLFVAIALLFVGQTTAQAPAPAPVETTTVSTLASEELVTDTEAQVLQNDATATWSDYMDVPQVGEEFAYTWVQTYTFEPDEIPATWIVLQSIDLPNVWHAYEVQPLSHT